MNLSPFALEAEVVVLAIYESGLIVIKSLFVFSVIRIICAYLTNCFILYYGISETMANYIM